MTITRRTALKGALVASASLAVPGIVRAAPRRVIVIGAGAAGMTAADRLLRRGIQVQVYEAGAQKGGRIRRLRGFADFPIDLGGEWIHTDPDILKTLSEASALSLGVIDYNPKTLTRWNGYNLRPVNWMSRFYWEYKFHRATWYGFFDAYVAPLSRPYTVLNAPVQTIDTRGSGVRVTLYDGRVDEADAVICTVPITILQQNRIRFLPDLPDHTRDGLNSIVMGDGVKVFLRFKERFYPDVVMFDNVLELLLGSDPKIYYDAAFGKGSQDHVLGLFAVDHTARPYTQLDHNGILRRVLGELDDIFDGEASRCYLDHFIQNWSAEPWIRGGYSSDWDEDPRRVLAPRDGRLFFAGEALGGDHQATVHGAAFSGADAAEMLRQS